MNHSTIKEKSIITDVELSPVSVCSLKGDHNAIFSSYGNNPTGIASCLRNRRDCDDSLVSQHIMTRDTKQDNSICDIETQLLKGLQTPKTMRRNQRLMDNHDYFLNDRQEEEVDHDVEETDALPRRLPRYRFHKTMEHTQNNPINTAAIKEHDRRQASMNPMVTIFNYDDNEMSSERLSDLSSSLRRNQSSDYEMNANCKSDSSLLFVETLPLYEQQPKNEPIQQMPCAYYGDDDVLNTLAYPESTANSLISGITSCTLESINESDEQIDPLQQQQQQLGDADNSKNMLPAINNVSQEAKEEVAVQSSIWGPESVDYEIEDDNGCIMASNYHLSATILDKAATTTLDTTRHRAISLPRQADFSYRGKGSLGMMSLSLLQNEDFEQLVPLNEAERRGRMGALQKDIREDQASIIAPRRPTRERNVGREVPPVERKVDMNSLKELPSLSKHVEERRVSSSPSSRKRKPGRKVCVATDEVHPLPSSNKRRVTTTAKGTTNKTIECHPKTTIISEGSRVSNRLSLVETKTSSKKIIPLANNERPAELNEPHILLPKQIAPVESTRDVSTTITENLSSEWSEISFDNINNNNVERNLTSTTFTTSFLHARRRKQDDDGDGISSSRNLSAIRKSMEKDSRQTPLRQSSSASLIQQPHSGNKHHQSRNNSPIRKTLFQRLAPKSMLHSSTEKSKRNRAKQ